MVYSLSPASSLLTCRARGMMGRRVVGNPTVDVPAWSPFDDQMEGGEYHLPVSGIGGEVVGDCMLSEAALAEMRCYLQLSEVAAEAEGEDGGELADPPMDAYSCDEFRMYDFKVRRCGRGRSHDWTECPYAHPGEKARRRDPRKHHYSGSACPEFRQGICMKGDACEFSHGVFECWLHPARYRTQPCKDGTACRRRVCFFAHTPEQLRVLSSQPPPAVWAVDSYDGSPMRHHARDAYFSKGIGMISSSPTSTLISMSADSPPISPIGPAIRRGSWPMGSMLNEAIESLRNVHLKQAVKSMSRYRSAAHGGGLGSPVGLLPGFCSLPSTPTGAPSAGGRWPLNLEGVMELDEAVDRVDSGRALTDEVYGRLNRDGGGLDRSGADIASAAAAAAAPDFDWVSELIK